jgi:hypothetical protein
MLGLELQIQELLHGVSESKSKPQQINVLQIGTLSNP